jgi:hypothetical protein
MNQLNSFLFYIKSYQVRLNASNSSSNSSSNASNHPPIRDWPEVGQAIRGWTRPVANPYIRGWPRPFANGPEHIFIEIDVIKGV